MFELHRAHPGRRTSPLGGAVALTVLGLCASALPAHSVGTPSRSAARSTATALEQREPEPTTVHQLAVPAVNPRAMSARAAGSPAVVAELAATTTPDYAMVGVTWTAGTSVPGTVVEIATRTDGAWSGYEELEAEADPTSTTGTQARGGTAPLWVGTADGIAVRVVSPTGQAPRDLTVATIEPDQSASSTAAPGAGAGARINGPVEFPGLPNVVTRREWGADPDLGDTCWDPIYGRSARAVVVHHTVNSNDYSRRDGAAIVRSILAYHTQGQGWCDIGYNFLVDRFGRIYQGRRGGIRLPVRGAHSGDYNTDTVGVSMIGDYDRVRPTRRLKNAMVRLIGWRLGTSYTPIFGRARIHDRRLRHIFAHGTVMPTACPGRYGENLLPVLRRRVRDYLAEYDSPIRNRAATLGRRVTGRIFVGEVSARGGFVTTFENGKMVYKRGLGAHWLSGRMLGTYAHFGGVRGRLGYPRSDVQRLRPGISRLVFEHGRFYKIGTRRPRLLHGRVLLRWMKLDGVRGPLGAPISSVSSNSARDTAAFQHGRITWDKSDNTITVRQS